MIRAVLFDLDGTLLPMDNDEFTRIYFGLLAKHMAPHGYEARKLVDGIWAGTAAMVKNDGRASNEQAFWQEFSRIFGEKVWQDIPLFEEFYRTDFQKARAVCGFAPEAAEIVRMLKEKGVKICLTTASDRFLAESALRRNGVLSFFSELFTCSQVGKGKENPRIYRHALYYLNTEKDSTWVFEDAFHAVRTAKKDGFPVVGVYDPSEENNQQAIRELSDIYLRELTEMEEYF